MKRLYFTSAQYVGAEDDVDGEEEDDDDEDGDDIGDELADEKPHSHAASPLPGQSSNAPRGEKLHVQAKGHTSKTELLQLPVSYTGKHAHDKHGAVTNLMKIMQKQNEITEMLIKEQRLSTLPSKERPAKGTCEKLSAYGT